MGIHFYKYGYTTGSLFQLSDDECVKPEQVFDEFRFRTGIHIDHYGDTRLYPGNFRLLKTITKQKFDGKNDVTVSNFISFMDSVITEDLLINAAGD